MRKPLTNANPATEAQLHPDASMPFHVSAVLDPATASEQPVVVHVLVQPREPISVTTAVAAQMIGICAKSLLDSRCPRVRFGNKFLFEPAALRAFIGSLRIDPCSFDGATQ